jgi:hypothetical protein
MPTFLPNIPQSTDELSISQGNLLTNFGILGAIAGNSNAASAAINTSGTNSGFNWVYLPNNAAIPPTTFPSGQVALYGNVNATTMLNELYINKTTASTTASGLKQIPSTAMVQVSATQGWAYWPCGMLVKWGQINMTNGTKDVSYQTDFASPLYDVTNTAIIANGAPYFAVITTVYDSVTGSGTNFDQTATFQGWNVGGAGTFRVHTQSSSSSSHTIFNYVIFGLGA